uniref:Putative methyltransferase DDB_G0268948 n=1 Tax=Astyanax mexicanus TaxID=7994 RepID=A0A8B9L1J5_ASTMX
MSFRLFEEKHHASIYQKYGRMVPPDEVKELILQYLDKKKGPPRELAVDLGCGTGQNTRLLSPHFQKVVGIDVSESQVEVAKTVPGFTNLSYRAGPAEELPFPDASVDLLTAASAAHWFDAEPFLKEATRVLKPRGCMALFGYLDTYDLHYGSCGDRLNTIYEEMKKSMLPYSSGRVSVSNSKLQELYEAISFPDKDRIEVIPVKEEVTVNNIVGLLKTHSTFQAYHRADPQGAANLIESTMARFLKEMGVTSTETKLEIRLEYFCVLACKPQ